MTNAKYNVKAVPLGWGKAQHFMAVLSDMAILLPVFILVFSWRGFIQALVARMMGDKTAKDAGFLTLNPIAHIDVLGLLVILLVFFFLGGLFYDVLPRSILLILLIILGVRWTNPVPIDDSQFSSYRLGGILTSLSGPLANLMIAFAATGMMRLILWDGFPTNVIVTLVEILKVLIDISVFFSVIDLVPLPPFDGGRMLRYMLPQSCQPFVEKLEHYSLYIFMFLFFLPGVSDLFLGSLLTITMTIKEVMFSVFF